MTEADKTPTEKPGRRHERRLSSGALAGLYLVACLFPLGLALGRRVAPADPLELAAAALGLTALAAMAVQVFTSGRFEIVSGRLGIDKIMAFHKIAAFWVAVALIAHPLFYVAPTWLDDPELGLLRLQAYLTLPHYRTGVIALAALVLLVLSSALREKLPWRYEVWRASHVLLVLVALAAGLHHAVTAGRFSVGGTLFFLWSVVGVAVAMALIGVLYGWRWLKLYRRPWRLATVTPRADRMWELDIQPAPGTRPFTYEAGQFVWLTEGKHRFPLFDHPFSIADSPDRPGVGLIVKEAGDFTGRIGQLTPGTAIGLDGPYGEFTLEANSGDAVVLLAGGVGIAPIMGLLRDLVAENDPRPIRLGYAAGSPEKFACLDEIEAAKAKLDLRVMLMSEEDAPGWTGRVGRLDRDALRELIDGLERERAVAMICGPGPMISAVADSLLDLGMPPARVVYERFDYSGGSSRQDRARRRRYLGLCGCLAAGVGLFTLLAA